jgi:uncharacterized paraquat-inducible protein A
MKPTFTIHCGTHLHCLLLKKAIFQNIEKYKLLIELEFPNPEITEKASDIEDGWAMCPCCIDAWQPNQRDAMIICPKCECIMHSPYYKT